MLRKIHQIDIIVNNEPIELYDPEKLNLRINNVLFQPESMTSKTGEYSFSFEIPATPKNNKIFNFGNNMSKLNKFNTLYDCVVNVDGIEIFTGTLRLSDTQEEKYTCNLISLKVNKIEDIFGDTMMNELDWKVDFNGTGTINTINDHYSGEGDGYYFPLVCYGAFQKRPYADYGNDVYKYTDLLQIDSWNDWYWESFHPSFNLIELVKRCFKHKGYTLNGDILNDQIMKQIYLSEYIDGSQDPIYNLNKPSIGNFSVIGRFQPTNTSGRSSYGASGTSAATSLPGIGKLRTIQDLKFPKYPIEYNNDKYDFTTISVFDIFATAASTTDNTAYHYMSWPPNNKYIYRTAKNSTSGFIAIPADGLYTIQLEAQVDVSQPFGEGTTIVRYKHDVWNGEYGRDAGISEAEVDISTADKWTLDNLPVEIQLIRNTDETELIWTAENVIKIGSVTGDAAGWTQYPHEANDNSYIDGGNKGAGANRSYSAVGDRYFVNKGTTVAYDPKVNEDFICGFSSVNKSAAVLKNGRSWDPSIKGFNHTHYRQPGYKKCIWSGNSATGFNSVELTDKNKNSLDCPSTDYWSQTGNVGWGRVTCVVELKKNDKLYLKVVTRSFKELTTGHPRGHSGTMTSTSENGTYAPIVDYNLSITPYTPNTDKFINKDNMYYLPSDAEKEAGWGTKLNLGNFLNCKEKMSDFINNFIKTFNLQYNQIGQNVFINKNKLDMVTVRNAVDIDDRVITKEAKASRIDYPGYMQVKFAIAEDEAGAYRSIDTVEHQGANNWKDYIDRGSEKIQMDTTNESKSDTVESKFSYTWYQNFKYLEYDRSTRVADGHVANFNMPLIAKDEYFIEQNTEAMANDGLSLKQRMWFRDQDTQEWLEMWDGTEYNVTIPTNEFNGCTLNFKNERGSLLDRYFNVTPRTDSNYLTVECYLTPMEYIMLKSGAFVKFDDDLYIVSEIQGYDPSGSNTTELKLIKKV